MVLAHSNLHRPRLCLVYLPHSATRLCNRVTWLCSRREHQRQEDTFAVIVRQGIQLSQQVAALNSVKPAPMPTTTMPERIVPRSPGKTRSFLVMRATDIGINRELDVNRGKLFVNVVCENAGNGLIAAVDCQGKLFIFEGSQISFENNRAKQEEYFTDYLNERENKDPTHTLVPGRNIWFSPAGPAANPELLQELNTGQKVVVVVGDALYTDDMGRHRTELCQWMQPPLAVPPVWHSCLVHAGTQFDLR
jgi:hypothetical protein